MQVYRFPSGASALGDHPWWFGALAAAGLVTSFTSTLMFTALGSFYNRISDPDMGGAYLTLLNTIANMGVLPLLHPLSYTSDNWAHSLYSKHSTLALLWFHTDMWMCRCPSLICC